MFFWERSNLLNFELLVLQKNDFVAFVHCFSNNQKCKQHRNSTVSYSGIPLCFTYVLHLASWWMLVRGERKVSCRVLCSLKLAGQSLGKRDGSKCDEEESSPSIRELKAVKLFMVMTEDG